MTFPSPALPSPTSVPRSLSPHPPGLKTPDMPPPPPHSSISASQPASHRPGPASLSSIVAHLQRSALGGSAPTPMGEEDEAAFDRRVAEMLMKEAREKGDVWGSRGER